MIDPEQGHLYLTELSERDKSWDSNRAAAMQVQSLYEGTELSRYAERIKQCSRRLIFALMAQTEGEFRLRLKSAHFCGCRHCTVCQWRRSRMWRARFFEAVPKLYADYPKARYLFLTLTVKNCALAELRDTLTQMNKSWVRLSQRREFPAVGWVKSVEVTRNATDNSAHPHFHALLMVQPGYFQGKNYIKQDRWRELWQEALRVDYLPVVNIKTVRSRPSKAPIDSETGAIWEDDPLLYGILETLKYGVKVQDLIADADWLCQLTQQLHKTRSVAVGGILRNYLRTDEPEDLLTEAEDIDQEPDDSQLLYFDWMEQVRRYAKVDPRLV